MRLLASCAVTVERDGAVKETTKEPFTNSKIASAVGDPRQTPTADSPESAVGPKNFQPTADEFPYYVD